MPLFRKYSVSGLALLALTLRSASAFVPASKLSSTTRNLTPSQTSPAGNSIVFADTQWHKNNACFVKSKLGASIEDLTEDIYQSYGEESRRYRRTVYTHEDWVKHRSSNRFFRNLLSFVNSGIYKSLFKEVVATTSIAAFVVAWNMMFGEYQDFQNVSHNGPFHDSVIPILALPLAPFTLSSPALGLLLVFRTNTSYKRWDEARKNWGMNINHTRDLVRLGTAYYDRAAVSPERAEEDLRRLALNTWCFVRCMKRHLSPVWEDEDDFQKELKEKLPLEQAERIIAAAHRPNRALQDLSTSIENLPMHFMRRNEIHAAATIFEDNLGSSERLLTSPIPVFYSRHTARFLSFWLLLLPFGLWGPLGDSWNHINLIPTMTLLSVFLFGIEELATQLEEPFTILPMQGFCDKIYNWCNEIVSFKPGDNGMPVYYYDNYNMEIMDGGDQGGVVVNDQESKEESKVMKVVEEDVAIPPQEEYMVVEPEPVEPVMMVEEVAEVPSAEVTEVPSVEVTEEPSVEVSEEPMILELEQEPDAAVEEQLPERVLAMEDSLQSTSTISDISDELDVAVIVKDTVVNGPKVNVEFDKIVQERFPGAINNQDLVSKTVEILAGKGYSGTNTLLATSLCCDELARQLEADFNDVYGNNFNLGGLSGFPFAGNTGFGAMSAHIPDDGYCLVVYGPHVGITADGTVGKVERSGIALVDTCCGSAVAASNYLKGITDGGAVITTKLQEFTDFQQGAVQELILPHGKRLAEAKNRMIELPYALYDSQDMLMRDIVKKGSLGIKRGLALLGGIQINTGPNTPDYFVPMRFDYMNYRGEVVDDMVSLLKKK